MSASDGDPGLWIIGNALIEVKGRVATVVFGGIEKLREATHQLRTQLDMR
jgi:hypothetical protein